MSHCARQAPDITPELQGEQSACGSAVPTPLLLLDKTWPGDGKGHSEGAGAGGSGGSRAACSLLCCRCLRLQQLQGDSSQTGSNWCWLLKPRALKLVSPYLAFPAICRATLQSALLGVNALAKPLVTSWSQQQCVSPGEGVGKTDLARTGKLLSLAQGKKKKKIVRGSE